MTEIDRESVERLATYCEGPGNPDASEAASTLRALLARLAEVEGENARLRKVLELNARHADGIRGAVESNQVADKDVHGVAVMIRDRSLAALTEKGTDDER